MECREFVNNRDAPFRSFFYSLEKPAPSLQLGRSLESLVEAQRPSQSSLSLRTWSHDVATENIQQTCLFCRQPVPKTEEDFYKTLMKRIDANDPVALCKLGERHYSEGDHDAAFEYLGKAAELGDAMAHYNLSLMYRLGKGVEKDEKKETYHLEEAAIRGHSDARYNLGMHAMRRNRIPSRAMKHWIIAATLGHDQSIQALKRCYKHDAISKEDFAAALRAHHAAVNATKSPQREAAAKYFAERAQLLYA